MKKYTYYNFADRPARVLLDEDQFPIMLEIYEREADALVCRNELLIDIGDIQYARGISESEFHDLYNSFTSKSLASWATI